MRYIILYLGLILLTGCSINLSCLNIDEYIPCIKCKNINHAKNLNYDINKTSESIDSFFLKNRIIKAVNRVEYMDMIRDSTYLIVDYNEFISAIDDTYLSDPFFLSNYFKCAQSNTDKSVVIITSFIDEQLNFEKFITAPSMQLEMLKSMNDTIFNEPQIRLLFQILIYNHLSNLN